MYLNLLASHSEEAQPDLVFNAAPTPTTGFSVGGSEVSKETVPAIETPKAKEEETTGFVFQGQAATEEPGEPMEEEEQQTDCLWSPQLIQFFEDHRAKTGEKVVFIGAGCNHSMAILDSGKIYTFGFNEQSQLGLKVEAIPEVFLPTLVPFGQRFTAVRCSGGSDHTVLVATPKETTNGESK